MQTLSTARPGVQSTSDCQQLHGHTQQSTAGPGVPSTPDCQQLHGHTQQCTYPAVYSWARSTEYPWLPVAAWAYPAALAGPYKTAVGSRLQDIWLYLYCWNNCSSMMVINYQLVLLFSTWSYLGWYFHAWQGAKVFVIKLQSEGRWQELKEINCVCGKVQKIRQLSLCIAVERGKAFGNNPVIQNVFFCGFTIAIRLWHLVPKPKTINSHHEEVR